MRRADHPISDLNQLSLGQYVLYQGEGVGRVSLLRLVSINLDHRYFFVQFDPLLCKFNSIQDWESFYSVGLVIEEITFGV